jgi:uncharacterized membrane protein
MTTIVVPPEAPLIVHAAAAAVLAVHIGGGTIGMAAGSVAILARKGARVHRMAGVVFAAGMIALGASAAIAAPFMGLAQAGNAVGGVFVLYLVGTAWATVRRAPGQIGWIDKAAPVIPLVFAALVGLMMVTNWGTPKFLAFAPAYPIGLFALLAAACDIRMIRNGGISGPPRIARHLWRMSAALAIALGSFFLGQQKFLPDIVRGNPVLFLPMAAALALMIFWLVRYSFPKLFRRRPPPACGPHVAGAAP